MSTTSRLILSAIAAGVCGGATSPNQVIERKPGSPASENVGTSGTARGALEVGDAEDFHLAVAIERHRGGQRVEEHVDMAGDARR